MLNQFTWQDFISALLMVGIAYYAIAFFLLFHKEIIAFFKRKPAPSPQRLDTHAAVVTLTAEPVLSQPSISVGLSAGEPSRDAATEEPEVEEASIETNAHGYSGEELPEEQQPAQEIVVEDEPENAHGHDTPLIIGVVSDLLSEMKSLFQVCAENKTPRQEVLRFTRLILRRYVSLYQSEYKDSITLYIYHTWNEHLSHQVDLTEIAQCWLPNQPQ